MDILSPINDYRYAHHGKLCSDIRGLEEMLWIYENDSEKAAPYLEKYETLIRQHGACTPQSIAVLKAIASEENRAIIEEGNLLHLGNVIQPCTVSAPCTEDNDMGRKNIQYMYEGKKYSTTGETFADAVENAIKKHCAAPVQNVSDAPLFQEYAEKWFEVYRRTLKQNSAKNNESMLKKHLYPYFGQMRIDEITLEVVQAFFNMKMDAPGTRGKSQSTLGKMQILLGQVLDDAVEDGIIAKNPAKSHRLIVKGIPEKERAALTAEQLQHVFSQLDTLDLQDQLIIALPSLTGMRRGEFLGLQWDCVDLERRMIYVKQGRNALFDGNQPYLTTLKAKASERPIPILDPLFYRLVQCPNKQGFVIGGGSEPITESTYDRAWERIAGKIELYGATAHILRHTYATLIDGTVSSLDTKSIMGHADVKTTSRYTHKGEETAKRTQPAINQRFVQLFSDNSHEISHGQEAASA